jgi:pimeloyl-ACP methyl ester carboxylesterase
MTIIGTVRAVAFGLALSVCLSGPALSQQELEVEIEAGSHLLSGTLTLPAGEGPFPAAALISGSGRSDRDESLPRVALRPFAKLAAELQTLGIATLRYDDRGVGRSTGDFLSATSYDFASDAEAVAEFLADRPEIDSSMVGLIGHSEGGMVAPIVAARNDHVAFVVSLAGTAVPGYEVLSGQLRDALAALPAGQRDAIYASEIRRLDLTVAQDWPALEQLLRDEHASMSAEQQAQVGSADEYVSQGMIFHRGWLHTFATHNPAADWLNVRIPVLAIYGGLDAQVRADLNAPALELALAGNPDAKIVILPTANHLFQEAVSGAPDEYATLCRLRRRVRKDDCRFHSFP